MAQYQGHKSWNAWNVARWIAGDKSTYRRAMECLKQTKNLDSATNLFCRVSVCLGDRTPDGAVYNRSSIKAALAGLA